MSLSYGFLHTFPPEHTGAASFAVALMHALTRPGRADGAGTDSAGVVRMDGAAVRTGTAPGGTRGVLIGSGAIPTTAGGAPIGSGTRASAGSARRSGGCLPGTAAVAAALSEFDVVIVQHDDRFCTDADADRVAEVLDDLRVPAIVVLHSVAARPTPRQRQAVRRIVESADATVILTWAGRDRLLTGYGIDPRRLAAIPHGAPARRHLGGLAGESPLILTWGLLGPGKGVEWAIGGLHHLRDLRPTPRYFVVGETQMAVRQRQGEAYRLGLVSRAKALSVTGMVSYRPSYLDTGTLDRLIRRADVILVPTDSPEPVASAVLVEAIAAGKPLIAAAFPHAAEVLTGGGGLLVPVRDGAAIGDALRRVFTEPGLSESMAAEASRLAPRFLWPAVADRYRTLARRLLDNAGRVRRRS